MEEHFLDSTPSHYAFRDSSRHAHRHHGNSLTMGYGCGDHQSARQLQDTESLREKVRSCETGLGHIYQVRVHSRGHSLKYNRSPRGQVFFSIRVSSSSK